LNHLKEVESLLTQDHNLVNEIDLKGDQPLHIAAQSDCSIDIVKILIQYDAPIGRRNYEGLTPLGVARFHSQKEIVDLLNRYYEVVDGYVGEEPEKYKYERVDIDSIPSQALIRKLEQEAR
jgi:ankyrin repeat protein